MSLHKGDRGSWNTSQGRTQGKVIERRTEEFTFEGQKFNASADEAYYISESEKTGSRAAHKEGTLTKLKSD